MKRNHKVPEPPKLEYWMTINKHGINPDTCKHRVRSFSKKNGDGLQMCTICKKTWE